MAAPDIVMYEEEFNQIKGIISKLRVDANAKVVFLVDKNGQQIAAQGEIENLDTTSLASLTDVLRRRFRIDRARIFGHGELEGAHTACPGRRLRTIVTAMRPGDDT